MYICLSWSIKSSIVMTEIINQRDIKIHLTFCCSEIDYPLSFTIKINKRFHNNIKL